MKSLRRAHKSSHLQKRCNQDEISSCLLFFHRHTVGDTLSRLTKANDFIYIFSSSLSPSHNSAATSAKKVNSEFQNNLPRGRSYSESRPHWQTPHLQHNTGKSTSLIFISSFISRTFLVESDWDFSRRHDLSWTLKLLLFPFWGFFFLVAIWVSSLLVLYTIFLLFFWIES